MKSTLTLTLLLTMLTAWGQKNDYRWITGSGNGSRNADAIFTTDSCTVLLTNHQRDMLESQTTVSDSNGNLLFYSNGTRIFNAADSIMKGTNKIDSGYFWQYRYTYMDELLGLPVDHTPFWNLFTYYVELNFNSNIYKFPWQLRWNRIDMSADSGRGQVVFHDSIVIQDTLAWYVSACRHANGRDWWVLTGQSGTNCYYELLVQPDTIIKMPLQCLGTPFNTGDAGQAEFSPDGTKFAWCGSTGGVNIYDFDRCTGLLSNAIDLPVYGSLADSFTNWQIAVAFSPNSRYLYVGQIYYMLQFDVTANNVLASMDTVGMYHPPPDSTSFPGPFYMMQLAPNGKIYVCGPSSLKWWHVVNDPDLPGTACNFVNYAQLLPLPNSAGLPNYPNYRLGREIGSPCDTLYHEVIDTTDTTHVGFLERRFEKRDLKIFPNPVKDNVVIDYGNCEWSYGPLQLQITDATGHLVLSKQLPMYSGYQQIDVSQFAKGAYQVFIKRNSTTISTSKLVKQ